MSDELIQSAQQNPGVDLIQDALFFDVLVNIAGGMSITEACSSKGVTPKRFNLWIARHPESVNEVAAFVRSKTFERLEEVTETADKLLSSILDDAKDPDLLNVQQKLRIHAHLMDYIQKFGSPKFLSSPGKDRSGITPPVSNVPSIQDNDTDLIGQEREFSNAREFLKRLQPRLEKGRIELTERKIVIESQEEE